jgi:ABC-type branched-subunit amino acid transport system ATPase component
MRLEVRGFSKRFGGVRALNGVSSHLAEGEVLGLIGPNGSGKTTFVNCISGLHVADDGELLLEGQSISALGRVERARLGIARTFQNLRLFHQLSVWENVAVPLRGGTAAGSRAARVVEDLLRRLQLQDVVSEPVSNLPYGVQRRVELARALVARPKVLLLDEPAAGLNEEETERLSRHITWITDDLGCSVVLVDHDMALVRRSCHRVQVLDEGREIFEGSPEDALTRPEVVEAYLGVE